MCGIVHIAYRRVRKSAEQTLTTLISCAKHTGSCDTVTRYPVCLAYEIKVFNVFSAALYGIQNSHVIFIQLLINVLFDYLIMIFCDILTISIMDYKIKPIQGYRLTNDNHIKSQK